MSDIVERLCGLARKGDPEASAELVSMSYQTVFAYFRRLCGDETEACDLTQKTFVKVWSSLPSYQGKARFKTWLHAIAHHVYVDWRRKPNRNDLQSEDWWEEQTDQGQGPFESAEERDLAHRLYRAVEQLEENARETVHLHYYQGLSLSETAEALGIGVSTVKYRLQKALEELRPQFAEPEKPLRAGGDL